MTNNPTADAISAIALIDNGDDLEQVRVAFKQAQDRITKAAVRSFVPGDRVFFSHKKGTHYGTVVKTNRKTVVVDVDTINGTDVTPPARWKVAGSLLADA